MVPLLPAFEKKRCPPASTASTLVRNWRLKLLSIFWKATCEHGLARAMCADTFKNADKDAWSNIENQGDAEGN